MASTERQKVRFTGKRTGLDAIRVRGYGIVSKGEIIEIDADQADEWTAELPMRDGKTGSDWANSGASYKQSEEKTQEKEFKLREKLAEDIDPEVEMAHPTGETRGTVEEDVAADKEGAKG